MTYTTIQAKESLPSALRQAAQEIFDVCKKRPAHEPLVIGLCGGRSVVGLLVALREESENQPKEILRRVQFFMVDERLVPLTDEQSNYGGLKKLLFDDLVAQGVISPEQLHPFVTDGSLGDFGCARYMNDLQNHGGRFTIAVVGVGEDAHIAGLFPGHRSLSSTNREFLTFHDSPKPPADRMTASAPLITGADLSVMLFLGEGKRSAWNLFQSDASREECPAKLATEASRCIVVTDLA